MGEQKTMTVSKERSATTSIGNGNGNTASRKLSHPLAIQRPSSVHPGDNFSWSDFPIVGRELDDELQRGGGGGGGHSKNSSFSSSWSSSSFSSSSLFGSSPTITTATLLSTTTTESSSNSNNNKNRRPVINRPLPTHHNESVSWSDFPLLGTATR